jgi:metal-responsive CopG/Arc/MetJ family transcriptional regulator
MIKTIQMTLDDTLLAEVDQASHKLNTTRSAFIRDALHLMLRQQRIAELERQHVAGYTLYPVQPGELDIPELEHVWGDA